MCSVIASFMFGLIKKNISGKCYPMYLCSLFPNRDYSIPNPASVVGIMM